MSLNKVMLIGNVGKEPEVRHLDNGVACATLVLATSERGYTLQNGTQVPERTEWHNIVLWRGLADVVERYVHKGDKLFIEGKIRSRSYEDQNGNTRYVTEIFADNMEMLTARQQAAPAVPAAPGIDKAAAAKAASTAQSMAQNTATEDSKEDLPF
jgi:single-strand DNA-binding protein